jgi:hypothetical protein
VTARAEHRNRILRHQIESKPVDFDHSSLSPTALARVSTAWPESPGTSLDLPSQGQIPKGMVRYFKCTVRPGGQISLAIVALESLLPWRPDQPHGAPDDSVDRAVEVRRSLVYER